MSGHETTQRVKASDKYPKVLGSISSWAVISFRNFFMLSSPRWIRICMTNLKYPYVPLVMHLVKCQGEAG